MTESLSLRGIPVVFTSIAGLAPLLGRKGYTTRNILKKRMVREIVARSGGVQVCGSAEETALKAIVPDFTPDVIANPDFTQATDADKMMSLFTSLYEKAQIVFDKRLRENISHRVKEAMKHIASQCEDGNGSIADICSRIVYLRHLYIKGSIPQAFLDETSGIMTESNYDEDAMVQLLRRLKVDKFAAFAMELLARKSTLTEGFMPIELRDGKLVEKMERMVIQ